MALFQEEPFVMHNPDFPERSRHPYKGLCIDLLHELQRRIGFSFDIHLTSDGKYGTQDESGEWNGIIREILDGVSMHFFPCVPFSWIFEI